MEELQATVAIVDFGECLERECTDIGRSRPFGCNVTLTCTAMRAEVLIPMAAPLFVAAQILVRRAYESFGDDADGRIGVSFVVTATALELTVEHSHAIGRAKASEDGEGCSLLRQVVALAGGHFEARKVIGGCRWLVTIPKVG